MLTIRARIHARCLIPGLLLLWWMMPAETLLVGQEPPGFGPPTESTFEPVELPAQSALESPIESLLEPIPAGEALPIDPSERATSECLDLLESDGSTVDGPYEEFVDGEYVDGEYIEGEGVYSDCDAAEYCGESFCGPTSQYWMRFDYLLWWTNGTRLPALVTTSPADQPPGVLGDADTRVLFGNTTVNREGRSNFRATLGYWIDCAHQIGFEGDYFDLGTEEARYSDMSIGDRVLTRPFFDTEQAGAPAVQRIAYPLGVVAGLGEVGCVNVRARDHFTSTGAALRYNLRYHSDACEMDAGCGPAACFDVDRVRSFRLDLTTGYRYYRLGDSLRINEQIVSIAGSPSPIAVGTAFELSDRFRADNEFNGGEIGLIAQIHRGRWSFEFLAKMAVGGNRQTLTINGQTDITVPGNPTVTHAGGLLAMPSNSGTFTGSNLVVIPQFGAEVGFRVSDRLRAYVGYNLLLWAHVGRAADQIDMDLNLSQASSGTLVGAADPAFVYRDSNFWAQGLNVGAEFCF
ncbi:MAG TPA: BBP7 family outer membrane beta-barrel protein [Thermoguttaceae bacterium]|nr:BBP7 family outer membrane beta-barrel protein [Thermoguttaceae bacterium]